MKVSVSAVNFNHQKFSARKLAEIVRYDVLDCEPEPGDGRLQEEAHTLEDDRSDICEVI